MSGYPVTLRPPLWARLLAPFWLAVLGVLLVIGGVSEGGRTLIACAAGVAACVAIGLRDWTLRIEVHADRVVFVNILRSVVIPWCEIERFGYDRGLWVRRRGNGGEVTSSAFGYNPAAFEFARTPGRDAARRLEEIRKRRRGRGGGRDR